MRKIGTNIGRTHLTDLAAIAVVVILVIALGLRLYSESGPADEGKQSPEENGEQPQPTPARFEVSELVIEPDLIIAGESIAVSVKVTNVGDLESSYSVVLKINDVEWRKEEVTIAGGETRAVAFP